MNGFFDKAIRALDETNRGERRQVVMLDRRGLDSRAYRHPADGRFLLPIEKLDFHLISTLDKLNAPPVCDLNQVVGLRQFDDAGVVGAARLLSDLARLNRPRVITFTEPLLITAARIREAFGSPGHSVDLMTSFVDKISMKNRVSKGNIRVPSYSAYDRDTARDLLQQFGQVVIKRRVGAGSVGLRFASRESELVAFEQDEGDDAQSRYEVEQFVDGWLYHIDSVVVDSIPVIVTAGHSVDATTEYREHRSRFIDLEVAPGPLFSSLEEVNRQVLNCFEGFTGVTHHEVIVTSDGAPYFVEIAGRWGGGGTRPGFLKRTGHDLHEAMILAETGLLPEIQTPRLSNDLSGYVMIYASGSKFVADPGFSESWINEYRARAKPGNNFPVATNWAQSAAMISVHGRNLSQVRDRLDWVEQRFRQCVEE